MLSELFSIFSKLFTAIKNQFTKFILKPAAKKSMILPDCSASSASIDWSVKDVMVGTVRTAEQLQFSLDQCGYYVPAAHIAPEQLPVKYIALHEEGVGGTPGIKRYGEVVAVKEVKRGKIPVTMRPRTNPDAVYYYFSVKAWTDLPRPIEIKDSFRGKPQFTNKFLLDHCTKSYQLFAISSEEEYRLMTAIHNALTDLSAGVHPINGKYSFHVDGRFFTITDSNGNILERIPVSSFSKHPHACFNKIKKLVK